MLSPAFHQLARHAETGGEWGLHKFLSQGCASVMPVWQGSEIFSSEQSVCFCSGVTDSEELTPHSCVWFNALDYLKLCFFGLLCVFLSFLVSLFGFSSVFFNGSVWCLPIKQDYSPCIDFPQTRLSYISSTQAFKVSLLCFSDYFLWNNLSEVL